MPRWIFETPEEEVGLGIEDFPGASGHSVKAAPSPPCVQLGRLGVLSFSLGSSLALGL